MLNSLFRLLSAVGGVWRIGGIKLGIGYALAILQSLPEVLKSRSLGVADRRMAAGDGCYEFQIEGRRLLFLKQNFTLAREIWGQNTYFIQPGFGVKAGDQVLDLGANVGGFTMGAAAAGAKVLAIEAQAAMLPLLEAKLKRNNLTAQVTIQHGFVGSSECLDQNGLPIGPKVNLEDCLARAGWDRVDFLKADIEGGEFPLFAGNPAWLRKVQRLGMEVHPEFGNLDQLRDDLISAGFAVQYRNKAFQPVGKITEEVGFCYAWRAPLAAGKL